MGLTFERYSNLTREQALDGSGLANLLIAGQASEVIAQTRRSIIAIHEKMKPHLVLEDIQHIGYDGMGKIGQIVVHEAIRDVTKTVFGQLLDAGYPIEGIRPMTQFGWEDTWAMQANNTSCYRPGFVGDPTKEQTSKHAVAVAFDVNPRDNPMRPLNGPVEPANFRQPHPGSYLMHLPDIRAMFSTAGFEYGGTWNLPEINDITGFSDYYPGAPDDLHHFELRDHNAPDMLDMTNLPLPDGIYQRP